MIGGMVVLGQLGQGAFGRVYLTQDSQGMQYATKVMTITQEQYSNKQA